MKKKKNQSTIINYILDESGSMDPVRSSVISGFNEYVKGLKKTKCKFTLTKFDTTGIRIPYVAKDIADVEDLTLETYKPNAMTPLYDAVCQTIKKVESEAKDAPVLIAIMTDGEENSSKEFSEINLSEMITRLTKKGNWTFVFMGANQDSWATATKWGIPKGNISNWKPTHQGTQYIMRAMASSSVNYMASMNLGGEKNTTDFFAPEKSEEEKEK